MNYELRKNSITDGLSLEAIAAAFHTNTYQTHGYRFWHKGEEYIFVSNIPPSGGLLEVAVVNQSRKRLVALHQVGWVDHIETVVFFFRDSLEIPPDRYMLPDRETSVPMHDDTNVVTLRCMGCDIAFTTKADLQQRLVLPQSIAKGLGYCPVCEAILKPNKITK